MPHAKATVSLVEGRVRKKKKRHSIELRMHGVLGAGGAGRHCGRHGHVGGHQLTLFDLLIV